MANFLAQSIMAVLLLVCLCVSFGYAQDLRRSPPPRTCREAEMCCQGQNNTCFVLGMRLDRSPDSERCYCDSNCLIMGDCCTDYHRYCKSVDCKVGQWSEWTECNNPCGYGSRKRLREVTTYPDNGGHNCPVLKQRRACVGYQPEECKQQNVEEQTEELNEKARILPLEFGEWRAEKKWNPWKGILKNLYHDYYNKIFTRPTYRSKFTVTSAHYGCENSEWAKILKANVTICVECQPIAMNREVGMRCMGHGVKDRETKWTAVDVPHCHGTWVGLDHHKPEVCDLVDEKNFIFL